MRTENDSSGSSYRATVRRHACEALSDQSHPDSESVKETVLQVLHRHHPEIALEDVLELNVLVSPPESGSFEERVDAVLIDALEQSETPSTNEPGSTPGTRGTAVVSHGEH